MLLQVCLEALLMSCFSTLLTHAQDHPEILVGNTTTVDVSDADIAHFTCSARAKTTLSINWWHSGKQLANSDKGVEILSMNCSLRLLTSHLFLVVAGDDQRGDYVCVASNQLGKVQRTFTISKGEPMRLTITDHIAIGLATGLSLIILVAIAVLLIKRTRTLKKMRKESLVREAHSNLATGEEENITTAL